MPFEFQGTVTQKSNGTIVITPTQNSKQLPAMGDEVTVTIEVTSPVEPPVEMSQDKPVAKKANK
jgi:hypothetical protein